MPRPTLITYIVTENPDSHRSQALKADMERAGIQVELFTEVDVAEDGLPVLREGEVLDQEGAVRFRKKPLTNSEIQSYLLHYRAIQAAYLASADYLCLLEEDTVTEWLFSEVLDKLIHLPPDRELICFVKKRRQKRKVGEAVDNRHILVRPVKGIGGSQGYLINRSGMEKVIRFGSRIFKPFDKFLDHFWEIDLHVYCIEPQLIWMIPRNSSKKTQKKKPPIGLKTILVHKMEKFRRNINRRIYLMRHRNEFSPMEKPGRVL